MRPHAALWPLSIPYIIGVGVRNRLFDIGLLKAHQVDAPVISIGNISVGGSGKTPFAIYLANKIRTEFGNKLKPAVVSRGYKGNHTGTLLVSDGQRQFADFWSAGDEPKLIADKAQGSAVVVDKNRVRGAKFAVEDQRAGCIILDDGFQHRRLKRDLDIVLLDASNPLGNRLCLPAGPLREPTRELKRADLIVLSKAQGELEELTERARKLSELMQKPVIVSQMKNDYWRKFDGSEILQPDEIKDKRTLAFAGLASPGSFFDTVEQLGAEIVEEISLPDHAAYNKKQVDRISLSFVRNKCEWLVTTAKDAVKLPPLMRFLPLYSLDAHMDVVVGKELLMEKVKGLFD